MRAARLLSIFREAYREIGGQIRYPGYSSSPPSSGCCFVTAAVVQRIYGGELLVNRANHSFINQIEGRLYDFTSDQYGLIPPKTNSEWSYVHYNRTPRTKRIEPLEKYVRERL